MTPTLDDRFHGTGLEGVHGSVHGKVIRGAVGKVVLNMGHHVPYIGPDHGFDGVVALLFKRHGSCRRQDGLDDRRKGEGRSSRKMLNRCGDRSAARVPEHKYELGPECFYGEL